MTSLISHNNKLNLGARQVPFGYSLPLTITGMKDEQCLGSWVQQFTLWRSFNIRPWFLVSDDIKIKCGGTRHYYAISRARWFALHFSHPCFAPTSLIMPKSVTHVNQTYDMK